MLLQPGMVGRTLHGEVERDLELEPLGGRDEAAKVLQRPQFRMHGVMAAFGGANGVGASGMAFSRGHRVVAALAVGVADGVNRGQVHHVEAHRGDIRQPHDAILEGAVLAGCPALAARHHLVPSAGPCPRPVRHQRKQLRSRQVGPQLALGHRVLQFGGQQRCGVTGLQKILALPQDHRSHHVAPGLRLGEHASALDRLEGQIGAGLLLQLESVPPGCEFIGPGLDGIDIASGLVRDERSAPAVIAVMGHRLAAPFAVLFAAPDQRSVHNIMSVAVYISPDLDALAGDALHRKAAAVDQRINVFNMKSAAGCGALDSLSCFVHGDAIDMEATPRFLCGKGDVPDIYTKPLAAHWFPGNAGDNSELSTAIFFLHLMNFVTVSHCCVQTACRMDLFTKAKDAGIQTEFIDGQGHRHVTGAAALRIILDALPVQAPRRLVGGAVVVRSGQPAQTELEQAATFPVRWKIVAGLKVIAQGETGHRIIAWPADLPIGSYRLHLTDASSFTEEVPLMVAPPSGFGGDFDRCWLLAVQLYGIRSAHNWGIGDFTDLEGLIELAGHLGADGIGLNPLHALFDDRPTDCSPYSPNSRLFLNALYVDVEKLPEFRPDAFGESAGIIPEVALPPPRDCAGGLPAS